MEVPAEKRRRQHESDKAMRRLKPSEIKRFREELLAAQGFKCALCGETLFREDAVLDHHHKCGWIRGVLHRGCNALLGKIENNWRRVGVPHLGTFIGGVFAYLESTEVQAIEVFHPSYRTLEEKRLLRNKRARRKRKAKKAE